MTDERRDHRRTGSRTGSAARRRAGRDQAIDTMRGIAILMVIGIHSLQQPLDTRWAVAIDAALRPCVPLFLFASGYLTALSGRVPLAKRLKAALIPYAIAFAAAYLYMALHNPAMDHRAMDRAGAVRARLTSSSTIMCSSMSAARCHVADPRDCRTARRRMPSDGCAVLLILAIAAGLIAGSYLDPLLSRLGLSGLPDRGSRMRDIPFWFSFMALGSMAAMCRPNAPLAGHAPLLLGAHAGGLCDLRGGADFRHRRRRRLRFDRLLRLCRAALPAGCSPRNPRSPLLASIGSGSYFIYLWHIFVDHAAARSRGAAPARAVSSTRDLRGRDRPLSVIALADRPVRSPRPARCAGSGA